MRGAASLAAAAARWPVRVRGASRRRQVAGAVERRRSGRCGGCGAEVRGPRVEEVSRAASRCHDGAAPVGAGCSPAPAPPPGGVCLPLPSLLRRGRRHCPSPPQPGRPPPTHTRPLGLPPGGALGLRRRRRQRPARRRLHFPSFVSALETGSWLDRSPGRGPPCALRHSRGG